MNQPHSSAVSWSFLQYFVYFHFRHCDVLIKAKIFISWGGSGRIFIFSVVFKYCYWISYVIVFMLDLYSVLGVSVTVYLVNEGVVGF